MTADRQATGKLISHGSIYLLGNILRRAISFIMLPIYTRYLTTEDYGTLELLTMIIDFVAIIVGLRISEGIFRFYGQYAAQAEKDQVVSTAMIMIFILNLVGCALVALFREPLSLLMFGDTGTSFYILLFAVTIIFQGLIEVPLVFIRNLQLPWHFIFFSICKLALQLGLNIYFVVIRQMHVEGVIYSALISGGIMSLVLVWYTLAKTGLHLSPAKAKELLQFSLPLIFTSLITFYITFGDRYFLRLFSGLSEVGIYALGYKFGFLLMFLVVEPFSNIWNSEKYRVYQQADAKKIFQNVFLAFSLAIILVFVGISLFVKDVLMIMSIPTFWPAYKVVPVILMAYALNAWVYYANFGILIQKKTIEITYGTIIAAVFVTLGYVLLIPPFGALGAAWATVLAFGSRCAWVTIRSAKLYDMGLPWGTVGGLAAYAVLIVWAGSVLITTDQLLVSVAAHCGLALVFLGGLLLLPILPAPWRRELRKNFFRPWQMLRSPAEMRSG